MKRGPRPKGQVKLDWSSDFAYAIGLIVADGCLSKDGRHIDFTSKDKDLVLLFSQALGLSAKISKKFSGSGNITHHVQFGDVLFYAFLVGIGLSPAKSKTISSLEIPRDLFCDFLRGYFDGDGSSCSYNDPVFPRSFRFFTSFTSASPRFIEWLRRVLRQETGVSGYVCRNKANPYVQLKYAKSESITLCKYMYYRDGLPCLRRKRLKVERSLRIIEQRRGGEIGRHASFRS